MARFAVHLIGTPKPLDVDLPFKGVGEIAVAAASARFLEGHLAEPNEEGVCVGVLIPTCRLQCVMEAT